MDENESSPRVTALVVSHNEPDRLRRCLAALETSSNRAELEIIAVESGPTVSGEFPNVRFLKLAKYFGFRQCLNIGTRTARGEFMFILRSWAEVLPDTIPILVARIVSDNTIGAVTPYVERTWPLPTPEALAAACATGELPGARTVNPDSPEELTEYPAGAPILIRRAFIIGMNYIDKRYGEFWVDAEICRQVRGGAKKILVIPAARISGHAVPPPDTPAYAADRALGAAGWLGKHTGAGAGFKFHLSAIAHTLGKVLTFQRPGYNLSQLVALVSSQKVDGNHSGD